MIEYIAYTVCLRIDNPLKPGEKWVYTQCVAVEEDAAMLPEHTVQQYAVAAAKAIICGDDPSCEVLYVTRELHSIVIADLQATLPVIAPYVPALK